MLHAHAATGRDAEADRQGIPTDKASGRVAERRIQNAKAMTAKQSVKFTQGIVVPKGTPSAIVNKLNKAANDALRDQHIKEIMLSQGNEIGGGSVRIHRKDVQERVFTLLGMGEEEAQSKFGFLLDAFSYGAPPHGGIAFGLDRLAMLMAGAESIRDVIAFPKTQTATCPLTDAPTEVSEQQLRDLHIRVKLPVKE